MLIEIENIKYLLFFFIMKIFKTLKINRLKLVNIFKVDYLNRFFIQNAVVGVANRLNESPTILDGNFR